MARYEGQARWFNNAKGYSFLGSDEGVEVFCHFNAIEGAELKRLHAGELLEYDVRECQKSRQAAGDKVRGETRSRTEQHPQPSATNPAPPCRLLCCSRVPLLLETRLGILSRLYAAKGARSLLEVLRFSQEEFDLILLCYSLSEDDRRAIVSFSRTRWPNAKVLSIARHDAEPQPDEVDASVPASNGPAALLQSVDEMLHSPVTLAGR